MDLDAPKLGQLLFLLLWMSFGSVAHSNGLSEFQVQNKITSDAHAMCNDRALMLFSKMGECKSFQSGEATVRWGQGQSSSYLVVLPKTKFAIEEDRVTLRAGSLRLVNLAKEHMGWKWFTPPVEIQAMDSEDWESLISHDPMTGLSEIEMVSGRLRLQPLGRDEYIVLNSGEKIGFQSKLENGEPAFDVMLKGKSVVRGDFLTAHKLTPAQIKEHLKRYIVAKYEPPPVIKPKIKPGQICSEPFAKFAECSWQCLSVPGKLKKKDDLCHCVRRKCDANGKWSDEMDQGEMRVTSCPSRVSACDY